MTGFGLFQPSVSGMTGHSHAMQTISGNIANVTTNAYKRAETSFSSVLSRTYSSAPASGGLSGSLSTQSDIGGIRPTDNLRVRDSGEISGTGRQLDLAISGAGFFVLNTELTGAGEEVYSRDGALDIAIGDEITLTDPSGQPFTTNEGYLADSNGYFLQGWAADANGTITTGGATGAMRVDDYAFTDLGQATTAASLSLNLPASANAGATDSYTLEVFDDGAVARNVNIAFTKAATANTWSVQFSADTGDSFAISPPDASLIPGAGQSLNFDSFGQLTSPTAYTVAIAHPSGASTNFTLDVSELSQWAGGFIFNEAAQDGYGPGDLASFEFDERGRVIGSFTNGTTRPLYQVALADFANVDGLTPLAGNVYTVSEKSGEAAIGAAGTDGLGAIIPNAIETSNVDLAHEFSRMIMTQNAYNSSATAFRTVDEMTELARDLKT